VRAPTPRARRAREGLGRASEVWVRYPGEHSVDRHTCIADPIIRSILQWGGAAGRGGGGGRGAGGEVDAKEPPCSYAVEMRDIKKCPTIIYRRSTPVYRGIYDFVFENNLFKTADTHWLQRLRHDLMPISGETTQYGSPMPILPMCFYRFVVMPVHRPTLHGSYAAGLTTCFVLSHASWCNRPTVYGMAWFSYWDFGRYLGSRCSIDVARLLRFTAVELREWTTY